MKKLHLVVIERECEHPTMDWESESVCVLGGLSVLLSWSDGNVVEKKT